MHGAGLQITVLHRGGVAHKRQNRKCPAASTPQPRDPNRREPRPPLPRRSSASCASRTCSPNRSFDSFDPSIRSDKPGTSEREVEMLELSPLMSDDSNSDADEARHEVRPPLAESRARSRRDAKRMGAGSGSNTCRVGVGGAASVEVTFVGGGGALRSAPSMALSPSAAGVSSVPSTRAGKLRAGESSHRFTATERVGRLVESFA